MEFTPAELTALMDALESRFSSRDSLYPKRPALRERERCALLIERQKIGDPETAEHLEYNLIFDRLAAEIRSGK